MRFSGTISAQGERVRHSLRSLGAVGIELPGNGPIDETWDLVDRAAYVSIGYWLRPLAVVRENKSRGGCNRRQSHWSSPMADDWRRSEEGA